MPSLSDLNAYSKRSGVDSRGFAFAADKQGGDEAVDTTLKAWDKLQAYENEMAQAKAAWTAAQADVSSARGALSKAATPEARAGAEARLAQAESQERAAAGKYHGLVNGQLGFQRQLLQKLGLDTSRLTEVVKINDKASWVNVNHQDNWVSKRANNPLEEWAQVFHAGFGKRDGNGTDVLGSEPVQGKEAIESFMRYGQWSLNEMLKELGDKIMKAIQRAGAGKGFSMTADD